MFRQMLKVIIKSKMSKMRTNIHVKEFTFKRHVKEFNSFTFIYVLILLIFDLIMTLSERRNVVAFFNFLIKMVLNFLNSSTLSQFFIVKLIY